MFEATADALMAVLQSLEELGRGSAGSPLDRLRTLQEARGKVLDLAARVAELTPEIIGPPG
jgi:hypothetical protein